MPTVILDKPTDVALEEHHGAVVGLRRLVSVVGLSDGDVGIFDTALGTVGVPAANSTPADYPNLILVDRNCRVVPGHPDKVEITCIYRAKGDAEYGWKFRCSSVLNSVTSQVDVWGNPVTLSHTYGPDDPDYPGETKTTGAEYSVMSPSLEVTATGVIETNAPLSLAFKWTRVLNRSEWAGGAAGRWCCVNVESKPLDLGSSPQKHTFTFTFQYRAQGWLPKVWFIDERTGRPPADVVEGVGTQLVDVFTYLEFNDLFPNP